MTKQNIRQEAHEQTLQIFDEKKVPRMCANCVQWERRDYRCSISGKQTMNFMTCPKHEFQTEFYVRKTMECYEEELLECKKIEEILAVALTSANMVSLMIADLERRVKSQRKRETDSAIISKLKKDLDLCDDISGAFDKIEDYIEKIDQQYRFYVQSHLNKLFNKDGKYDGVKDACHQSNAGEYAQVLYKYTRACKLNKVNSDIIHDCMDSCKNDMPFPLDKKDIEHYRLKE